MLRITDITEDKTEKTKPRMSKKKKAFLLTILTSSLVLVVSPYARGWINEVFIQKVLIKPVSCFYKKGWDFCTTNRHP